MVSQETKHKTFTNTNIFNLTKANLKYFKKTKFLYISIFLSAFVSILILIIISQAYNHKTSASYNGDSLSLKNIITISPFIAGLITALFTIILNSIKMKDEYKSGISRNKIIIGNSRIQLILSDFIASIIILTCLFVISVLLNILFTYIFIPKSAKELIDLYYQHLTIQVLNSYFISLAFIPTILLVNSMILDMKLQIAGVITLIVFIATYEVTNFLSLKIQTNPALFIFILFIPMIAIRSGIIAFSDNLLINIDAYYYLPLTLMPWMIICIILTFYVWKNKEFK